MSEQIQLQLTKRFERDEDDQSRVRPVFFNNADVVRIGNEIYFDMCVMPMDDFARAKVSQDSGGGPAAIEVIVLERFVCGADAFFRLFENAKVVYDDLIRMGVKSNAELRPTQNK